MEFTPDQIARVADRGGEIGFYLLTPPGHVYYSERAYQPDREVSGGFIHLRQLTFCFLSTWSPLCRLRAALRC